MKLGLALSGGGVRGASHIGVLKAFEENNIKINYISGASSGSIVAALYSVGYKPIEIEKIFLNINKKIIDYDYFELIKFILSVFLKKKVCIDGLVLGNKIENLIDTLVNLKKMDNICDTKIPLAISSVDINTSDIIMFTSKKIKNDNGIKYNNSIKISEAVRASISFPGIFKPKIINKRRLVDGGVRENVPIEVLKKMGAHKVIAVNLGYCGEHDESIDNILEIINQTIDIMAYNNFVYVEKNINFLMKPRIYNVKLLEIDRIPECIQRGYSYACKTIPNLKNQLFL